MSGVDDAHVIAQRLIDEFGSLGAVLFGAKSRLARAARSKPTVDAIRKIGEATRHALKAATKLGPLMSNGQAVQDYLFANMAFEHREQVRVLYLTSASNLIADEIETRGDINTVMLHPREILVRALELGASRLLVVHNHPSGDPRPSPQDVAHTHVLIDACRPLGIHVVDHLIVGRLGLTSLRERGIIR